MTHHEFDTWLTAYGAAWEARDAEAFAGLFTDDVCYFWTPFEEPKKGRDGVAGAFTNAVANQRDIHFSYEILAVGEERCVSRFRFSVDVIVGATVAQIEEDVFLPHRRCANSSCRRNCHRQQEVRLASGLEALFRCKIPDSVSFVSASDSRRRVAFLSNDFK